MKLVAGVIAWLASACLLKEEAKDKFLSINPCVDPKWSPDRKIASRRRHCDTALSLFLETSMLFARLLQTPLSH